MRPPFTKPAGIFNMAANMTRSWCVVRFSKTMISLPLVRQTLLGGTSSMSTEAAANHVTFERPTKKKEFRRVKAEIYKKNRQDSKLERLARKGALNIPLETVRKEWMAKYEFSTTTKLARHYGIFEHMLQGNEFIPSVRMLVTFGQTDHVHYGNFLTPSQASQKPTVNYDCSENSYWTLTLANPDGNLLEKKKEILHWMIGNIPGSKVSDGELLCDYLPPIPIQGTGFHRFVFCLLKQSGELDLNNYVNTKPREIASRTFSLAEFLSKHGKDFTPAGLCFFQAVWDKSVTQTFTEILDMTEPAYKEQEFVTPTKARRILVRQWFEGKYRNM